MVWSLFGSVGVRDSRRPIEPVQEQVRATIAGEESQAGFKHLPDPSLHLLLRNGATDAMLSALLQVASTKVVRSPDRLAGSFPLRLRRGLAAESVPANAIQEAGE